MSQALAVITQVSRPRQVFRVGYEMQALDFTTGAEVLAHSRALYARLHARPEPVVARIAPVAPEPAPVMTMAASKEELAEVHRPQWRRILEAVAKRHGLTPRDIIEQSRHRHVVLARREAIYYVVTETGMTFPAIGRVFCRDHTSIINNYKKYKAELAKLPVHKRDILVLSPVVDASSPIKERCSAVIRDVARKYGITPAQITGSQRRDDIAEARKEVFLVLYTEFGLSFTAVGKMVGDKSHATIIKSIGHLVTPRAEAA